MKGIVIIIILVVVLTFVIKKNKQKNKDKNIELNNVTDESQISEFGNKYSKEIYQELEDHSTIPRYNYQ
uniref:Uncharacterized protein n=1 Tax=viral metagenome TaxID=1070528 RepID=A0A6C0LMA9_9ZZZZ